MLELLRIFIRGVLGHMNVKSVPRPYLPRYNNTFDILTPRYTKALTASCSVSVNRACWYNLRRSSSGTPSRYWIYKQMIRSLCIFLPKFFLVKAVYAIKGRNFYITVRLSNRGTISSTRPLGTLPSDVKPVAQDWRWLSKNLRIESREGIPVRHWLCLVIFPFQRYPYSFGPYSGAERTMRTKSK